MILNDIKIKGARVLILGATFKEDCPDLRNSKIFDLIDELNSFGCSIHIYEPLISVPVELIGKKSSSDRKPF